MEIPVLLVAAAYLLVLIGIIIVGSLNVYTAMKYGMHTSGTMLMSVIYIFGVVSIILVTVIAVVGADWSETLTVTAPATSIPGVGL